ncbi:MAG: response regulator transcription factor, partial [Acidimicrobiales bacterium]
MNGSVAPAGRVLVVDDDDYITDLLATGLRFVGYEVQGADSGRKAIAAAAGGWPDVIVLDVMMSDLDGFEVCRRLRGDGITTPVIFLTARDAVEDKVGGLRLGADDYITKPFSLEEVVARIETVMRRSGVTTSSRSHQFAVADLVLDDESHVVRRAGRRVDLSATEFKVLRYLMLNAGRVLSRPQILEHVWQYDFDGESTVVETYISYLRRKVD